MSILNNSYQIKLLDEELILLPQKAIFFKTHKTLLAADLHLGKTAHFRNAGIPVPSELAFVDLKILSSLLDVLDIERFIILGDLFHSEMNIDWRILKEWRDNYRHIKIQLVKGNHDILTNFCYQDLDIEIFDTKVFRNFLLVHDYKDCRNSDNLYKICGHVHPGVTLVGKGRQKIKLSCFYFNENYGMLPSFGRFTGKYFINPKVNDYVFVIADAEDGKKVIRI